MNKKMKNIAIFISLIITLMFSGCSKENSNLYITEEIAKTESLSEPYYDLNGRMGVKNNSEKKYTKLDDLKNKRAGVLTGTPQEAFVREAIGDVQFYYFNSFTDLAIALKENKIDFFLNNTLAYSLMKEEYTNFDYIDETICALDIGTIFPKNKNNKKLVSEYNEYIKEIRENGKLDELTDYWLNNKEWEKVNIKKSGENGILKFATCTSSKPFSLRIDGEYAGFDVAIVNGFCEKYGYGLEIEDTDFAGILAGITNGKYDLAASQIAYTDERAESVLYSEFYYVQKIVAIIMDDSIDIEKDSFSNRFKSGLKKTFIEENRYQMILSGIKVTIIISILGFLLAIILGVILCAMSMSRVKPLRIITNIYSKVMQGTPIVVILMIIYYIIFAKSGISNVLVAIIGFGVSSAANLSQIYVGAISQVNKGEIEAALSLGFSKGRAFAGIVLPQAIRFMLPALGSQFVALMKGTAIVGYIAVMDMTKVSDIIRSSTYEAVFPLLSVALIYFIISTIILLIFDALVYHMNPVNRRRKN